MKKINYMSILMLIVMMLLLMVACGGDGDGLDRTETDLEKFYRLSGVKEGDYELWKQNSFSSNTGTNYLIFTALRNLGNSKSAMFHIWVFNKNTNKITMCSDKIETVYTDSYWKVTYKLSSYEKAYDINLNNVRGGEVIDIIFYYKVGNDYYGTASKCFWFNNNEEITYIDGSSVSTLAKKSSILEWYNNTIAVSCGNASAIIDINGNIIKTLPNNLDEFVNPHLNRIYYYLETYDYDKGLRLHLNNTGSVYKTKYYIQVDFLDFSNPSLPYKDNVIFNNLQITDPYDVDNSTKIISSDEVNCNVRLSQGTSTCYLIEINKKEKTATCKKE